MSGAPSFDTYFAKLDSQLRPAAVRRGARGATQKIMAEIVDILATFDGSMSTRQVYYQLVSRGVLENCGASYDKTQRLIVTMRRDGLIAYDRIVDRTRTMHKRPGWEGAADIMHAVQSQYRRDAWAEQNNVVMVACEKQALEGVFAEVCDEYGAGLWTLRGFVSESFAFEWATEINKIANTGRDVMILYFGDFDPSGLAIEHDAMEKLRAHNVEADWQRCGLMPADFDAFNLVNVDVKTTDSRAKKFLELWGPRAAELDALPPDELRDRVRRNLEPHLDLRVWEQTRRTEAAERESLQMVAKNWDLALAAVRA